MVEVTPQVTYTTNAFASPEFVGAIVSLILLVAGKLGLHVFDDIAMQQMLAAMVGMVLAGVGHYFFPHASGRLGLTAPAPWNVPPAQTLPKQEIPDVSA